MWWKSAVRRSRVSLCAFRIRAAACGTLTRHWVRRVLWQSGFPVEALSSGDSAEGLIRLLQTGFGFLHSLDNRGSFGPNRRRANVHGRTSHQNDACDVAFDRESLGTPDHRFFGLNSPDPYRCRRFACPLAGANARRNVVWLLLRGGLAPPTFCQFAWRRHRLSPLAQAQSGMIAPHHGLAFPPAQSLTTVSSPILACNSLISDP